MWIYLETAPRSGLFHNHGQPDSPNSDPQGFKRLMEARGLRVVLTDKQIGIAGISRQNPTDEQRAGRFIPLAELVEEGA
jgi:hypothetical protein